MPDEPRYGDLEGNPVRFTRREAWMFAEGTWRPIHPAEVYANAAAISREEFFRRFPLVQTLPYTAFQSGDMPRTVSP